MRFPSPRFNSPMNKEIPYCSHHRTALSLLHYRTCGLTTWDVHPASLPGNGIQSCTKRRFNCPFLLLASSQRCGGVDKTSLFDDFHDTSTFRKSNKSNVNILETTIGWGELCYLAKLSSADVVMVTAI